MKFSKAIEGFIMEIQTSYSPNTVYLYRATLPRLAAFLGDPDVADITLQDLQRYMQYLQTTYRPKRPGGDTSKLSPSSVDNYWKGIRSFFNWASATLNIERPDKRLARPAYKLPEVIPFTEAEIQRLIKACNLTDTATTDRRKPFQMRRRTVNRDKALILLLLDTGLRVGETCRLKVQDVNLETGEILVAPHGSGQKTKPRIVYLGKTARRQLWLYLAKDRPDAEPKEKLFMLHVESVRSILRRLGEKTGINNVHPHRFRHTFAIFFLRNNGDVFSLQRLLGHSTLDMVRHYLDLSNADVENAHRKASPADNWKL